MGTGRLLGYSADRFHPHHVVCGLMGLAGVILAGSYRAASRRADGPEGSKCGSSLSFTISPMTGGCPAPAGMVEPWGKSVSSTSV